MSTSADQLQDATFPRDQDLTTQATADNNNSKVIDSLAQMLTRAWAGELDKTYADGYELVFAQHSAPKCVGGDIWNAQFTYTISRRAQADATSRRD